MPKKFKYMAETKQCTMCKNPLPINDFHKAGKGGKYRQAKCKKCMVNYGKKWKAKNSGSLTSFREKDRNRMALLRENDPEKYKQIAKKARLKKLGTTPEEYDKKFIIQGGCCAICKRPRSEMTRDLAQDHDHATGRVRGLLCHYCNTALERIESISNWTDLVSAYLKERT